jgi:PAS domain-containing protein
MPHKKAHSDGKPKNSTSVRANRAEMEFFGGLADGLGIGMVLVDVRGVVRYSNATFEYIFGVPAYSQARGTSLPSRIAAGGQHAFEVALAEARFEVVHGEFRIVSEAGDLRTVRVSLHGFGGKNSGSIWVLANEVTELV